MIQTINFKHEFAPLVEAGDKRQTIREVRKNPIKPGDTLRLYSGQRTKHCRQLWESLCLGVTPIKLYVETVPQIELDGNQLSVDWQHILAKKDGFDDAVEMHVWFNDQYTLPFEGVLIIW